MIPTQEDLDNLLSDFLTEFPEAKKHVDEYISWRKRGSEDALDHYIGAAFHLSKVVPTYCARKDVPKWLLWLAIKSKVRQSSETSSYR